MGDTPHITPEQASQELNLENVDADLISKNDIVTFGSLVRVGLELTRDPSLAQETAPNVLKLSNNAVKLIRDFATSFPSLLPLIKAGQSSPKGHFIFCSDSSVISAVTKWRFEHLPPSIILRTQAPPTPPPVKLAQQAATTNDESNLNSSFDNKEGTQKKARRGNVKRRTKKSTADQSGDDKAEPTSTSDQNNQPAAGNTNVWFQKNIENVKKSTPTKSPPKLASSKPKEALNKPTATNSKALTVPSTTSPKVEPHTAPSPVIRYADILKAPPPKKSTPPPPAAAPKAVVKAPPKSAPKESSAVAPPKAPAKRKKREPILLGDIVIKEQEAKKLPAATKSSQPPRHKAPPTVPLTMNTATDAVIVKRSKVRETPKPKKFSRLKKLILIERAQKWQSRTAPNPQPEDSNDTRVAKNDELNENESEDEDIDGLSDEDENTASNTNVTASNGEEPAKAKITKVKKVPNKFLIREYCDQIITDQLNTKLIALLAKLRELQTKMKQRDAKKAAMKKRFVVGLREVARSVKVSQIKLIVFAPDIEESSAPESLDDRVAEILEGAREMSVLCVFGLNRKKLGAALGFKLRMSVVGLSYIDGANDLYNEVVEYATRSRILFAIQRQVLERQTEARGAELIVPKFEATGPRDEGAQKAKNKIMFAMAKYKNEEKLPDYQKFTTNKLVDLLHDARSKAKNNLTLFVQDLDKNKIHLFEDLPPITKVIELKEQLLLRTATAKKLLPQMQLKFHDLQLTSEMDEMLIRDLRGLENYSTITVQNIIGRESGLFCK